MNSLIRHAIALPFALLATAAVAASYEDGLKFKSQQQLASAASVFAEVAAREPRNVLAREQLAIVLSWQSRFDESIAAWQQAIALAPQKPDYHLGLARVLYWKGEHAGALQAIGTSLRLQADNADALKLKGDVLLAQQKPVEARTAYLEAQQLSPGDTELATRIDRAVAPRLWRLDAGFTYDHYDNARKSENSRFVQLGRRVGQGGDVLYARYDGYDNFGSIDNGITLGTYWLPHPKLLLNLEAGRTLGTADFRPETQFQINGELLLDGPLQPLLGYRYFNYDNGTVTTITPGLRLSFTGAVVEARYGITDNIDGSSTGVFSARLGFAEEGYSPYLAFTTGSEALPPQAKADITIFGGGIVFDLGPTWGARVDYSYEDRKGIYKHHAVGAGLTYRF
ncbi:MAG: YaiO family outer membrane beta-barrel protein [Pseudomonadota bacterium]